MQRKIILSIVLLFPLVLFGQNSYNVLHPDKVDLGDGHVTHKLSFSTQANLDKFYDDLCRELGIPDKKSLSWTWDSVTKKELSDKEIKLTISLTFINGRDGDFKRVSITAENLNGKTILKPRTKTYRQIKEFFEKEIAETVF